MSDPREALLGRFRATLQTRVGSVNELFEVLFGSPSAEARKRVLGELHTLKGEARMLGLSELSGLAHALEEHAAAEPSVELVSRAMNAMRVALDPSTPADAAQAVLEEISAELEDLAGTGQSAENRQILELSEAAPTGPSVDAAAAQDSVPETAGREARWIQVQAAVVDALCERVVELSAAFASLGARTREALATRAAAGHSASLTLVEEFAHCQTLIDGSAAHAWSLRLVPIEPALRALAQHARASASAAGKSIDVRVEARGVELERDVLDQLWDSFLHLVQNAVDHGIEPADERGDKSPAGLLVVRAEPRGGSVILHFEDDGRGIDAELVRERAVARGVLSPGAASSMSSEEVLQVVFDHGFSTAQTVSRTSGRGIGLDVVKRKLESLGGSVTIETAPGAGTRFSLLVPYTVTRERALIIELGDALYGLPSRIVRAVLGSEALAGAVQPDVVRYEGESLPLTSLSAALGIEDDAPETRVLVLELSGRRYGAKAAHIVGEHELIRRPTEALLSRMSAIRASAVMDDGRLVLFPDLGILQRALRRAPREEKAAPAAAPRRRPHVLVVDDSSVVRDVLKEILVTAGLSVEVATDGVAALSAIRAREPDLVMTDLEMPRMNGFELLAELRKHSQRLPVIMLTTRASAEDRQRATELGANAYVLKVGFRSEALLDVVNRFVRVS